MEEIYIPGVGYMIDYGSVYAAQEALQAEHNQGFVYQDPYTMQTTRMDWDTGMSFQDPYPDIDYPVGSTPEMLQRGLAPPNQFGIGMLTPQPVTDAPIFLESSPSQGLPIQPVSSPFTGINPFDKVPWVGRSAPGGIFSTVPPIGSSPSSNPSANFFGNILGGIGDAATLPLLILALSGNSKANNWLMLAMLLGTLNDKNRQGGIFN